MASKNEKLNVGIIGLGRIADLHFPGYRSNRKARIYAVCDADEETARRRKKELKADKSYTDYRDLLADPEVDAVEILTPQHLHESMTREALQAGKHVALQKPMTIDLASADRILAAANSSDKLFRVTDNYCFYPPVVLAKKMIEAGEIGDVSSLRIRLVGGEGGWDVPASAWEWRMKEKAAGRGIQTFDHGHHLYATAWYLLGDVEQVTAIIDAADGIVDCPADIIFRHRRNGAHSTITFTQSADMRIPSDYYANDEWMEITGSHGIIFIHRCTGKIHTGPGVSLFDGKKFRRYRDVETDWQAGFTGATHNFINAIHGAETPLLYGSDARSILRVALSASRSSHLERSVYPEELDSLFPSLTHYRIRRRKRKAEDEGGILSRILPGGNMTKYAGEAKERTEALKDAFNPEAVPGWKCAIGIRLTADGPVEETVYSVVINNGTMELTEGALPDNPVLELTAQAGTWAAILMGKKRIEMAFIQGQLKISGKAEEGLKLRAAFGI